MVWRIEFEDAALKELVKLDKPMARRILVFLRERVAQLDPRSVGEALKDTKLGDFWKYCVGDYCVVAHIEDRALCVLMLKVGNRREVYR